MSNGKPLTEDQVVPGGLTQEDVRFYLDQGWTIKTTDQDNSNIDVVFKDPSNPTGYAIRPAFIPRGSDYLRHDDGRAVLMSCGNPSCWRWYER